MTIPHQLMSWLVFLASVWFNGDSMTINILLDACKENGIDSKEVQRIIDEWKNSKELFNRWYDSLKNNNPDYSIYDDFLYIAEAFWCWKKYSKKSINILNRSSKKMPISIIEQIGNPDYVVDLGCGIGLTTMMLKNYFPNSTVIGTNITDTYQWKISSYIAKENNFILSERLPKLSGKVVIVASEYFEHFFKPIDELKFYLNIKPQYIICANTFSSPSPGHFDFYKNENNVYSGYKISKLFNRTLREYGYKNLKTGYWNNRPAVWSLQDNFTTDDSSIMNFLRS